jgi:hypothetical protein
MTQQQAQQFHAGIATGTHDGGFDAIHAAHLISRFSVLANPHLPFLRKETEEELEVIC